ncbi:MULTISPECIES: sugar transferase [Streptococcus]|uniref:Beta-1,6-galactofuranosyltransferase WbbI n=1 Tax=Streptococcus gordonii TaxID=1302 RepID=A0AAW3H929_STRGN|nr:MULTISPECIES: sugar transferase [Streptococcus]ARC46701.1 galactofuranosyltransferase [Streptococcus gordonii]KJQ59556.1 Beta-1,6-galactofuranosyltransferase WbbI [Streptococcus gordonii]KJU97540.1 Beta-1,6-galactofuranosyltransferase WbbI [Streptococcus gordonii]MBW7664132.1 sugar transferase [Streptococcus gordonii]MBZ2128180.1 sugar transferase [Streptococcus gordonii]
MKYYLKDSFLHNEHEKNAGSKARNDVEAILISEGYEGLELKVENWYKMNFFKAQQHKYRATKSVFDQLGAGDELVIQFPIIHHTFFISRLIKQAQKRGAKFYLLIHDVETLRHAAGSEVKFRHKVRNYFQEKKALMSVDGIIVHNDIMKKVLVSQGVPADKMVSLEIFDYLIPNFEEKTAPQKDQPIIVAGNLNPTKSGYLYNLPEQPAYNLYGVGYDESRALKNTSYFGSFMPDNLPTALEGSFGLVWDGDSSETCQGSYGNYLRFNNSHKASLYLASGFPVVVWKESALAHFILEKSCGIAVASLHDLEAALENLTEKEYADLSENARRIGKDLREGYYLRSALKKLND